MKFEVLDDKYLFFTNKNYSLEEEGDISTFLKDMFLIINEIYSLELFGYFKVDIFIDEKIGVFVEISKLDDYISYGKKIDTKVIINRNNFYFKTNDLSLIYQYEPIYRKDNYYYVSTKDVDNVLDLLDFCEIDYRVNEFDLKL
ncbi:MAG: hypothetical protein E7162_02675 [Firmicutes bacterium]|nr:hypothetical protein [Bacillota bacterium]